jgi:L-ascorbate metabolism protein UlaG (beta-lactamase superfamily)
VLNGRVETDAAQMLEALAGPPPADVSMWWLGQAGLVLRGPSAVVAVDPYLTRSADLDCTYPAPVAPADLTMLDVVLATHDHLDHIDPVGLPKLLDASPASLAVVPAATIDRVVALGIDAGRLRGAVVGDTIEAGGVRVHPFAAAHGAVPEAGYGFHLDDEGRHPFLGYLVEIDGVRICHTGDTIVYDGLAETLRSYHPDVLLIPINGRSWFREQRGIVGNVNVVEAAELAALSGARITIPIHWDLFADNLEDPEHFRRHVALHHPDVRVLIPTVCRQISLRSLLDAA